MESFTVWLWFRIVEDIKDFEIRNDLNKSHKYLLFQLIYMIYEMQPITTNKLEN